MLWRHPTVGSVPRAVGTIDVKDGKFSLKVPVGVSDDGGSLAIERFTPIASVAANVAVLV
jgi:hypothetical protein